MKLKEKKIAILAADEFDDREALYPLWRMQEEGAEVKIVAPDSAGEVITGKHGFELKVDYLASEVQPSEFQAIIIPGGWSPDEVRLCKNSLKFVRKLNEEGKVIAAICHAGWVLVSADIVEGRTVTSYVSVKDDLENAGADWVNKDVVIDGNIITSRTPADLPVFGKTIIEVMVDK